MGKAIIYDKAGKQTKDPRIKYRNKLLIVNIGVLILNLVVLCLNLIY